MRRVKTCPQSLAFEPTHRSQLRNGCTETGDDRRLGGAPILFALVLIDDVDHAFERQDPVEPRRGRIHAPSEALDGREHGCEHGLVDAHAGRDPLPFDRERAMHRAARKHLCCVIARRAFDRVPARR